jgi:hypothetical protein
LLESDSMPRLTLRRLLLTAAILPPLFAAAWFWFELGKVRAGRGENAVRQKLLSHTPPGTSAVEVLEFVVNDLYHSGQGNAYHPYLKDYAATSGRKLHDLKLTPTDNMYGEKRVIEVVVSSVPSHFLMANEVAAIWHFDGQDRLTDITTRSYSIGP